MRTDNPILSAQARASALSASQQVRDDALRAEVILLRDENRRLQTKFEASQAALAHAINGHAPQESADTLDLWWDALVRGDGQDKAGNTYDLTNLAYRLAKEQRAHLALTRAELDQTRGERDRARDLAVRSGVFTRRDDAHSLADRPEWEDG